MRTATKNAERSTPYAVRKWGRLIKIHMTVDIPDWLERLIAFPVILYRRLRYGYAFRKIPLTQGQYAIVDPDDYRWLSKYIWYFTKSSSTDYAKRYERQYGRRRGIFMHREILNVRNDFVVDHINHNGLDNRKANLRPATKAQNNCNSNRERGKAGFRGVTWNKRRNKWQSQLTCNGKHIHVGCFDNKIEAAKAYDEVARKMHGEFATLNFGNTD